MSTASLLMTSTAVPATGPSAILIGILPWLLIFVIFYMLMIRPQQKRVKEHQETISAVKKGDEVADFPVKTHPARPSHLLISISRQT